MEAIINKVPEDFYLANIYVSVLSKRHAKICWIPIHFRNRYGGTPSIKAISFVKHGITLFRQLRAAR
jgi:hypothetical protein